MHCILLSHVFIREGETEKLESVEFAIKHWGEHNPEAFIIITGHGQRPRNLDHYCNYIIWEDNIIEKEIHKGHPYLVSRGLEIAERKGFRNILKSRCDTIHTIKNVVEHAKSLLPSDKKMLVTQQTSLVRQELGDLFLYGPTSMMQKMFNIDKWYPTKSGLNSLANNFLDMCDEDNWRDACLNNLNLVDIYNLKWIDFRSNWQELKDKKHAMLSNNLNDEHKYYWGVKEKWHVWDEAGNCTSKLPHIVTEEEWQR